MPFDILALSDRTALLAALRAKEFTVCPRGSGRDTRKHVEPCIISHLLASLAAADRVEYPVSLAQRDKPDFKLTLGNCCIGVEVREVIERDYARYVAAANKSERQEEPTWLEPGHFRDGRAPTREEIQARPAQPYYGDEPEREWASHMAQAIKDKQQKLPRYENFGANWLALYDNLHCPNVNLQMAVNLLEALLANCRVGIAFDAIFIESGASIIKITPDGSEWITCHIQTERT